MRKGMLRIVSAFICAILMLIFSTTAMAAERTAAVHNPDSADRLNLRTKPSEDAPTLGKYYNGVIVELLGDVKDGWAKVRFHNLEGYMKAEFLEYGLEQPNVASAMPSVTIKNAGGTGLNLRKTQSVGSTSLGLYKNGSTVIVYGVGETWCHVQTSDGNVGFMLRESLSPLIEFNTGAGKSSSTGGNETVAVARVNNPNPDDRLNLRTKPSTDAPSLGKYYNGVDVTLLGPEENGWYHVKYGTLTGYMQAKFLETDPDKMWMVQSASISFRVNNSAGTGLDLRESQSTKSKSLGFYKNGEIGYLLGVGETWCHVGMGNNEVGFMLRESLSPVPVFDKDSGNKAIEGSTYGKPGDPITDDYMPGGNG